jgi:hypothetical protein
MESIFLGDPTCYYIIVKHEGYIMFFLFFLIYLLRVVIIKGLHKGMELYVCINKHFHIVTIKCIDNTYNIQ